MSPEREHCEYNFGKEGGKEDEKENLRDLATIEKILEEGTVEKLEELRIFYNLSPEQIDLFVKNAGLRKEIIAQSEKETEERKRNNPEPTEEELSMVIYKEILEWPVRDAVLTMRQKGYATMGSGFDGFLGQKIYLSPDSEQFKGIKISEELVRELTDNGIEIEVAPDAISFNSKKFLEPEKLKAVWDRIAAELPDLGHRTEPSDVRAGAFLGPVFMLKLDEWKNKNKNKKF